MSDLRDGDSGIFEAARSVDVVNARIAADANPRLREIMEIVTRHLHAAVAEVQLTTEEWMTGIKFLTDTGHMCTEWRQEFILLSDVLGVSMLVDAINHERPAGSTENTVLGPFYLPDAPRYANGADICLDGKGEPLLVSGRVVDGAGNAIAGATIDVWAANEDGFYDVQQKGIQPDFNLRGVFTTEADGSYWFRSVKPRHYPIPDDGPVGKMLAALGRHPNRAAHLHFIISAPGHDTVVTHIFTPDCPYLKEDAVFGVKSSLIADFQRIDAPQRADELGFTNPFWAVKWDVVLAPAA
ncbi:intradiol ring-cleavage dioxygenase [Sphingomonas sp. SRS2]|uniref:intradiol ring-cleavage dioxygenase n=1 Tax=Sphingomonas sp. SRS2 TaxID=133190 RepID=UPI0006183F30|nr:intradiol ring-cleavage dioxygenase [Sphingomonas sp. SRS2]KKC23934.1 6-chlorohydroxyquinol-1,2-dioxygenase [Sphingomonas sp. SRS2]